MSSNSLGRILLHARQSRAGWKTTAAERGWGPVLLGCRLSVTVLAFLTFGVALLLCFHVELVADPQHEGTGWLARGILAYSSWLWLGMSTRWLGVPCQKGQLTLPLPSLPIRKYERALAVGLATWAPSALKIFLCALVFIFGLGISGPASGDYPDAAWFLHVVCLLVLLLPAFVAAGFDEGKWQDGPNVSFWPLPSRGTALLMVVMATVVAGLGAVSNPAWAVGHAIAMSSLVAWLVPRLHAASRGRQPQESAT